MRCSALDAGLSSAVSGGGVSQQAEPLSADIEQLDADNAPQSVSTALAESSSNDENEYDGVEPEPETHASRAVSSPPQPAGGLSAAAGADEEEAQAGSGARRSSRARSAVSYRETASDEEEEGGQQGLQDDGEAEDEDGEEEYEEAGQLQVQHEDEEEEEEEDEDEWGRRRSTRKRTQRTLTSIDSFSSSTRRRSNSGAQLRGAAAGGRRGSRSVAASWVSEYTQRPRRQSASSKRVNYRVDASDDEDEGEEEEDEQQQDDDADDEEQEEDERAVDEARRRQRQEADSDAFAIERVLDSRQRADGSGCSEYLIQWHGDSHLFDTWHSLAEAEALCESGRGLKKLSNFLSREREAQQLRLSCSGEETDIEQLNVQMEMLRQEREDWTKVEKIIASRQADAADVRRLQRIRQRRRTFRLQPEPAAEADERQQQQEEEKQPQHSRTVGEGGHEEAAMMEEEKQQQAAAASSSGSMEVEEKQAAVSVSVLGSAAVNGAQQLTAEPQGEAAMQDDAAEEAAEEADSASAEEGEQTVTQYLVKWRGLTHDECSWESADDIAAFQSAIDDFLDLEHLTAAPRPAASSSQAAAARRFRELQSQPAYLSRERGELREYQLEGLNWLIHNWCQGINGSQRRRQTQMGLGKTIQCIAFLCHLFHERQVRGPFLIIVPLSTLTAWQREFSKWAPAMNVVGYVGNARSRDIIRQYEWSAHRPGRRRAAAAAGSDYRFHVVLSTYEFVMKDRAHLGSVRWLYLMIDEAHRLKDSRSQLYQTLFSFPAEHRLLITGTPLQNTLSELWSLLHFIHRDRFPSLEQFQSQHASVRSGEMAGLSSLHSVLKPHLLRRTKKDVLRSLPAKREKILLVQMTPLQRRYARWIIARNYRDLNRGVKGKKASLSNVIMELKKCCNHPFLTRPPGTEDELAADAADAAAAGDRGRQQPAAPQSAGGSESELDGLIRNSGKLILLDKLLRRLKQTGHRVLIFSQMVRMLDLLAEYLRLRGFLYQRLDGGMRSQERQYAMDHFNAEGSLDFCFLLSTKAGGLGINLATADTVVIFDSDWNPQNDLQAEARAHRIGQRHAVNIYRLVTRGTVEEDILRRAKQKMILDHLVIQRMDTSGRSVVPSSAASASSASSALFSTPSSALFDNRELAKILQFGAEDLFADSKDDEDGGGSGSRGQEDELDIDEILLRADSRAEDGERPAGQEDGARSQQEQEGQTEAFLSAFKVASFRTGGREEEEEKEEEEQQAAQDAEPEDDVQFWSRVIPSSLIPAEQLQEEGAAPAVPLFLPPRQRRAVLSYNETKLREAAEEERADSELSDDSEDDGRGAKAVRRRGRKHRGRGGEEDDAAADGELSAKDVKQLYRHMLYFGDDERVLQELFASSWKHRPQTEQSRQTARAMIRTIMQAAEQAVLHPPPQQPEQDEADREREDGEADNADEEAKEAKRPRAKQKKLSIELMPSVLIHPAELLQRRRELQRLQQLIAAHSDPLKFRITNPRRAAPPVRWTRCIWRPKQDAMLMYGVALHGMNGWDAIVDDPQLRLKECIVYRRRKDAAQQPQPQDAQPPGSSDPPAPSAAADEMEEIRSVKNHQLAARAALLLRLMMPDDGNAKAAAAGPEKAAAADKRKRGREEREGEQQRGEAAAAEQPGGRQREEQPEPAKRKKARPARSEVDRADAAQETPASVAKHSKQQQQQGAKADEAGRAGDRGKHSAKEQRSKRADSGLSQQPQQQQRVSETTRKTERLHDAPAVTAASATRAAAQHRDGGGSSGGSRQKLSVRDAAAPQQKPASASPPAPQRRKLSAAVASASSPSLTSAGGGRRAAEGAGERGGGERAGEDEDDVLPELIAWCKARLASFNASLKELHRYAQSEGGFLAHRQEVRPRLLAIGDECARIVAEEQKGAAVREEVDRHLWHYVSCFTRMSGQTLRKLYLTLSRKRTLEPHSAH